MIKKIIVLMCMTLWVICLTSTVFADINLEQSIDTNGGDLDGNWLINTDGGEAEITINGVKPFGTYINYKDVSGNLGMDSVYSNIAKVFMSYNYMDKSYTPIPFNDNLDYYQKMFRYVMEQTFMRKQEYAYRESIMVNQIEQLNLRILTLESFFDKKELCDKGLIVAVKENVSKYSCEDIKYYNKRGEFIGIQQITGGI